ncbi:MAG TPA: bifunctional 5,10-methylenetetrahydrofolate dehydrogenase/5,10-methenyltetrahydrofolate cyclohydrolase [Terriglobia bacterium]|nr:bifunctional 5,10-methylenetetrahydrofolate dehydrogenase/5,10-methenyltetrahydrofolate cyclohydrolase [Terriglobia bacterium]
MTARILSGAEIARQTSSQLEHEVAILKSAGITPGLVAILVGENPASRIYVRRKTEACAALGLSSEIIELPAETTTMKLVKVIQELNARDQIDGILVQLPLPSHVNAKEALLAIDPAKDVDGLHPVNVGNLVTGRPGMVPCTAAGIIEILTRSGIPIEGTHAVVVGRSEMVGKPVALLLLQRNATVTICHSRTERLPSLASQADILIAAIGKPSLIRWDYIKEGATVIDVGMNRLTREDEVRAAFHEPEEALEKLATKGSVLIGDVQPEDARDKAGAVTPVPGGVGLLTVAMLMANTVRAARLRRRAARTAG